MSKRGWWILGGVALLVFVGVPVASQVAAENILKGLEDQGFAEGGEARLLADLERVKAAGIFAGRGTKSDAAPTLNALIEVEGPMEGTTPAWWAGEDAFAAVDAFKGDGDPWLDRPEVTDGYDLTFLAGWRGFDHWTWDGAEPFTSSFKQNAYLCPMAVPIPHFLAFRSLAQVRLAQGWSQGDIPGAAADAEHLAMLLASTDTLMGELIGVAILQMEDRVIKRALAEGKLTEAPPRTWTTEDLAVAKTALLAVAGVYETDPTGELAHTLNARAHELPGVCAAIAESAVAGSLLHDPVSHHWPGEHDFRYLSVGMDDALATSGCEIPFARLAWTELDRGYGCFGENTGALDQFLWMPYARSTVVATIRSIATANYLGPYGKAPPAR